MNRLRGGRSPAATGSALAVGLAARRARRTWAEHAAALWSGLRCSLNVNLQTMHRRYGYARVAASMFGVAIMAGVAPMSQRPGSVALRLGRTVAALHPLPPTRVDDAVVDSLGDVFLLDSRRALVYGFSRTGKQVALVGGPGLGPGRFASPTAITLYGERSLVVYDYRTRRVTWYRVEGGTLLLRRAHSAPYFGYNMCSMGAQLYLFGYDSGSIVHVFRPVSGTRRSFGDGFGPRSDLAQLTLTGGRILCVPKLSRVIVASAMYTELRAYSTAGTLVWSLRLRVPRPTRVELLPRGGAAFHQPEGGADVVLALVQLSDEIGAVQVGRARPYGTPDSVRTYYFSLRNGRTLYGLSNLPLILASRPPLLVTQDPQPAASLRVRRFEVVSRD